MLFTIFFSKFALIIRALKIKIEITFNLRLHRRPIQLVMFVPVGLPSFLRYRRQVLLGVEVSSVARPGQWTAGI